MREILFRGKANSEIREGEWVYGSLLAESENTFPIIARDYDNDEDWLGVDLWDTVEPHTVGQYTGLTDKNGKKIFEGDIVKQIFRLKRTNGSDEREIISVIEYGISWNYSSVCGVCQRFSDGSGIAMLSVMDNISGIVDCEVIGNIHDNPELLKGE